MTSKPNTECYVYITLPGETESVTAGRFELTKDRRGDAVGRFVYGKSYLARANAVAIDPIELKLSGNTYDLMLLGTSMGGARPKAVVEDDEGLWVAKFNRPNDPWNNTRVERAMLELAKSCGISVATSRIETVADKDVLLVKRFDREKTGKGYTKSRMISGLTLLHADEAVGARDRWSYVLMSEELRRVARDPKKDAPELFRRMAFNALISNIDDHPRNHALIAKEREWQLSPAYDLTPAPQIAQDRRDLAMAVGDQGRFANAKNVLSQHTRFLLEEAQAKAIVFDMADKVRATWYEVVRGQGVTEKDAETIKSAFVYEGFLRE
jgi:serine/threonine-protein kinase HipA